MSSFARNVLQFYDNLSPDWQLPQGFELIFPFSDESVMEAMTSFYTKFMNDDNPRVFLFGINPGRFGAGVTGIPFTDPKHLEEDCKIHNEFTKKYELSSQFVYLFIKALGGPRKFYQQFYITSVCPLGFLKEGINANYYDERELEQAVLPKILKSIHDQIQMGCRREVAYSIGQGKNFKFLKRLNDEHGFFGRVIPLPHPRWVMQYRRKKLDTFVQEYVDKLSNLTYE